MIIRLQDIHAGKYKIFDCEAKEIPNVYTYDTYSQEVYMYLELPKPLNSIDFISGKGRYLVEECDSDQPSKKMVLFTLKGSYALDLKGNKV